jgi:hypothetical protein
LGIKKLKAIALLESGMNDLCEGFSKESKRVLVLYCENCWAETDREKRIKQKAINTLFIQYS